MPAPRRGEGPRGPYARIYRVVRRIPEGRVSTYGRVAALAGLPGHARMVGYALHAVADDGRVPWHRVVNARGAVSARRAGPGAAVTQRIRLEHEGVEFDARGRIALARFGWPAEPPAAGSGSAPRGTAGERPRRGAASPRTAGP